MTGVAGQDSALVPGGAEAGPGARTSSTGAGVRAALDGATAGLIVEEAFRTPDPWAPSAGVRCLLPARSRGRREHGPMLLLDVRLEQLTSAAGQIGEQRLGRLTERSDRRDRPERAPPVRSTCGGTRPADPDGHQRPDLRRSPLQDLRPCRGRCWRPGRLLVEDVGCTSTVSLERSVAGSAGCAGASRRLPPVRPSRWTTSGASRRSTICCVTCVERAG